MLLSCAHGGHSGDELRTRALGDGSTRSVALATLALIAVAACVALLVQLSTVVVAALIAIVIGSGIAPLVRRVERRGVDRTAAALIVYVVILSTLLGLSMLVLPRVIESATLFVRRLPDYYVGIRQLLERSPSQVVRGIALAMPEQLAVHVTAAGHGSSLDRVVSVAGGIGHGLFVAVGVLVLVFYWLVYGDAVLATAWRSIPARKRTGFGPFIDQALDKLGAFIRGQLLISLLIGFESYVAFRAIGLEQADILGVLAGCLEGLPVVGPLLSMFAASLIALATQPSRVLWVIAAALAIQASESYLVWPRIMGRAVGVDPALCLVALAVFSSIWGVAGAFLSVPITVVGQLFYQHMQSAPQRPRAGPERRIAGVRACRSALARGSGTTPRTRGRSGVLRDRPRPARRGLGLGRHGGACPSRVAARMKRFAARIAVALAITALAAVCYLRRCGCALVRAGADTDRHGAPTGATPDRAADAARPRSRDLLLPGTARAGRVDRAAGSAAAVRAAQRHGRVRRRLRARARLRPERWLAAAHAGRCAAADQQLVSRRRAGRSRRHGRSVRSASPRTRSAPCPSRSSCSC